MAVGDPTLLSAVSAINNYVFTHPKMTAILGHTDMTDVELYPVNEQPESVRPYIIYNYRTAVLREQWWMMQDTITYTIFDTDMSRLIATERTLINLLRRYEQSAKDIHNSGAANSGKFNIHYVNYVSSVDMIPQDQEGGIVGRSLVFQAGYVDLEGIDII